MNNERKAEYQQPWGKLIEAAMKRKRVKAPRLATDTGLTPDWVRAIINGYRSDGKGVVKPVYGEPSALALLAVALGVEPQQLRDAGRPDAADEVLVLIGEDGPSVQQAKGSAVTVTDRLNPALAEFTDHDLLWEIEGRLLLMASKLHAGGEQALIWRDDPEWPGGVLGSVPPVGK